MLTGISIEKEYVCLADPNLTEPVTVYLTGHDNHFFNITQTHLFLGYKPLIIGVYAEIHSTEHTWLNANEAICLSLMTSNDFSPDVNVFGLKTDRRAIANVTLRKFNEKNLTNGVIFFYEGVHSVHTFISRFHQCIHNIKQRFTKAKSGNINLDGNLYDQVRVAYAIPRKISLITVSNGTSMNMFPTDLHGEIDDDFYISSLRHGGQANAQVQALRKIALSDVTVESHTMAYTMGANHMRSLTSFAEFPLHKQFSEVYSLPLPESVVCYRELDQIDFFDKGIHRIHLYKTANTSTIMQANVLTHIHQFYAQWRIDHGLDTKCVHR